MILFAIALDSQSRGIIFFQGSPFALLYCECIISVLVLFASLKKNKLYQKKKQQFSNTPLHKFSTIIFRKKKKRNEPNVN